MPAYEYGCKACGAEWELDQSVHDKPKRTCPTCKARKAERLIPSGGRFILKGGGVGWADNLYSASK